MSLLELVFRRAESATGTRQGLKGLILATTNLAEDDVLEQAAAQLGLPVYRGAADDVASRVLQALPEDTTHFLRLNGDSPFPDPGLIRRGLALARASEADFVSNIPGRTYPYGISVEIMRAAHYRYTMRDVRDAHHREHVTSALHASAETVTATLPAGLHAGVRMVVDTPQDLIDTRRVADALGPDLVAADYTRVAQQYIRVRASSAGIA